jgi:hypothetical protein
METARKSLEPAELATAITTWLAANEVSHDAHVHSAAAWKKRGETVCFDADLHLTAEGAFYAVFNHPSGAADHRLVKEFIALIENAGYYYEQGFAWSWHFYRMAREAQAPDAVEARNAAALATARADGWAAGMESAAALASQRAQMSRALARFDSSGHALPNANVLDGVAAEIRAASASGPTK